MQIVFKHLARHTNDRRRRSINFQTAKVTAFALHATKWLNARVTDLACGSVRTAPQLAVENNAATNSSAQRQTNNRPPTARCALPHLAERCGVRIVFDQDGTPKLSFQSFA